MKMIKHLPVIVTLMIMAGCATTFKPVSLQEVTPGMTQEQVVALLGDPNTTSREGESVTLHYDYIEGIDQNTFDSTIEGDHASSKRMERNLERQTRVQRFEVHLLDGKVVSHHQVD
jgi:outer membrane protein assembly factor BamE (lipoprotein component of BamABCDE complex)